MAARITMPAFPLTGGCQCGAVRYVLSAPPITFYACHCTECQKQTASAFGESFIVRSKHVEVTGHLQTFTWRGGSGTELSGDLCPDCGTRVFHRRANVPETLNIKAGTLDDTSWLQPAGHIWTKSKQPWVALPDDALTYDGQPTDRNAALIARWQEMTGA